jgi:hypothetical protein
MFIRTYAYQRREHDRLWALRRRVLRIDLTRLSALRCYEQDVVFTKSIWLHSLFFFHYK